jgi:hypothetical protein
MSHNIALRIGTLALAAVVMAASAGCGKVMRNDRSSSYLIITKLTAASGADPDKDSDELSSDVVTKGGVVEDLGAVTFRLSMKDIGLYGANGPSRNNYITVNRYRVTYKRSDGRNTPGVDVPFGFDGAGTVTVTDQDAGLAFVLVRVQAKLEPPLMNLRNGGGADTISTIADITFYGRDQAGNDISVTGSISVNFADWADPTSSN